MGHPRHLCGAGATGLALQIRAIQARPDIPLDLQSEAVLSLTNGSGIGLVEAAELEVLTVLGQAAQVAAHRQDDQCDNGSHPGKHLEPMIVWVAGQVGFGLLFPVLAKLGKLWIALQSQAEGAYGRTVGQLGSAMLDWAAL